MSRRSVQPQWCLDLPLQQQSVLLLAARGPDGVGKGHPCKNVVRAYRGTVLVAARVGRSLEWGEKADTFMSLDRFAREAEWTTDVAMFFHEVDYLPHHYVMHLLHGSAILAYHHPDQRFRQRWLQFYRDGCEDMHLTPEEPEQLDARLSDWGRADWAKDKAPFPTTIEYDSDEFGGGINYNINGQPVTGVVGMDTEQTDGEFVKVKLYLGGVVIKANPKEKDAHRF